MKARRDHVDDILEQWRRERPDLDVSAMGVLGRISRARRLLERDIDQSLAPLGINRSGLSVLAALRRSGYPYQLSPTELYRSLLVSSAAITNQIHRLSESGLLERINDPRDRRRKLVVLTAKGRRLIDQAMRIHERNELRMLSGLTERDRVMLVHLLRRLLAEAEGQVDRSVDSSKGKLIPCQGLLLE